MVGEYRIIIIDEENDSVLTNQTIDEEFGERLSAIVENGFEGEGSECERVCSQVVSMLEDAGIDTDNHDEMIEELEDMKFIRKEISPKCIKKLEKIQKTKGNIVMIEKKPEKKLVRRIIKKKVK